MLPRAALHSRAVALPTSTFWRIGRLAIPRLRSASVSLTTTRLYVSEDTTASPKKRPSGIAQRLPDQDYVEAHHRFREFELDGRVFIVTGGAGGLGLTLAEALVEAGGNVYCLDWAETPPQAFYDAQDRCSHFGGSLHYRQVDVQQAKQLDSVIASIAAEHLRMDGLIAAAGVQKVTPALDYEPEKITEMMNINYGGVYLSAVSCARQMIKYKTPGSLVLIGSMSGLNANKGFTSSVYNSSKAAVIQLGRSLAMEWGRIVDGKAIRVNVLCPGNIMTPMVEKNFADDPGLRKIWEDANMMGRISEPHEYRGAALFMLSEASSFMTGSHLVIDGGYTAW